MDSKQAPRDVMTVAEVASYLGISRNNAYKLIAASAIPSCRLGRRIVVLRPELMRRLTEEARNEP